MIRKISISALLILSLSLLIGSQTLGSQLNLEPGGDILQQGSAIPIGAHLPNKHLTFTDYGLNNQYAPSDFVSQDIPMASGCRVRCFIAYRACDIQYQCTPPDPAGAASCGFCNDQLEACLSNC